MGGCPEYKRMTEVVLETCRVRVVVMVGLGLPRVKKRTLVAEVRPGHWGTLGVSGGSVHERDTHELGTWPRVTEDDVYSIHSRSFWSVVRPSEV